MLRIGSRRLSRFGNARAIRAVSVVLALWVTTQSVHSQSSPYLEKNPDRYSNPQFGLDVSLPRGLRVCVDDNGVANSHGFLLGLGDDGPWGGGSIGSHFVVWFGFDADVLAESVKELARERCGPAVTSLKPQFKIPDHETALCQRAI